MSALFCK